MEWIRCCAAVVVAADALSVATGSSQFDELTYVMFAVVYKSLNFLDFDWQMLIAQIWSNRCHTAYKNVGSSLFIRPLIMYNSESPYRMTSVMPDLPLASTDYPSC